MSLVPSRSIHVPSARHWATLLAHHNGRFLPLFFFFLVLPGDQSCFLPRRYSYIFEHKGGGPPNQEYLRFVTIYSFWGYKNRM